MRSESIRLCLRLSADVSEDVSPIAYQRRRQSLDLIHLLQGDCKTCHQFLQSVKTSGALPKS
jgi:hypothetical protein